MFSATWWKRAAERIVKTMAQTFLWLTGADMVEWANLDATFIWRSVAIMGGLSLATSIVTSKWTDDDSDPSAVE